MTCRHLPNTNTTLKGPIIIDIGAIQTPSARGRGIGKYILNFCLALEREAPQLVSDYLLDPNLAPPGNLSELLPSGKIGYAMAKLGFSLEAKMFLCMWPLDDHRSLAQIMPPAVKRSGLSTAVLVYDMIMTRETEYAPQDPIEKSRFASRLEIIRAADLIFTISDKTKYDVINYFNLNETKVVNIGAAAEKKFTPLTSEKERQEKMRLLNAELPLLHPEYILCPTGSHPRKNNERLIEAFLSIDKNIRRDAQLVLSGDLPGPMANHFRHMASLSKDDSNILTTGQVSPDILIALYQCASFVVFPSLAEGFGLPIAEALSCGKRVRASAIAPFEELLGPEMLFNPLDADDIKTHLIKELSYSRNMDNNKGGSTLYSTTSRSDMQGLLNKPPLYTLNSWEAIAKKTVGAIDAITTSSRQVGSKKKRRLGIISPLPPAASGVAAYTYRLIEELIKLGDFSITTFADGPFPGGYTKRIQAYTPNNISCYQSYSLPIAEGLLGGFDQVLYCFGNSHHHLGALTCLPKRPGTVLAHDVRLTNLYRHFHGRPGTAQTGLVKDIEDIYGVHLEEDLCKNNELSPYALEKYSLLFARRVIALSESYLVHSQTARDLAILDALPSDKEKISVIPFAIEKNTRFDDNLHQDNDSGISSWLNTVKNRHLISHFGIVDPIKNPKLVLKAYQKLHSMRDDTVLAFVGPIDDSLAKELQLFAASLGIDKNVKFTGKVSAADFNRFLEQSSLALQPRTDFNGEASAAVANTLASGIPTVATDLGWVSDLPDDIIRKIPNFISDLELAELLLELLSDDKDRKTLSVNSVTYASKYSFSYVAQVLSEILLTTY